MLFRVVLGLCILVLAISTVSVIMWDLPVSNLEVAPRLQLERRSVDYGPLTTELTQQNFAQLDQQANNFRHKELWYLGGLSTLDNFYDTVSIYYLPAPKSTLPVFETTLARLNQWHKERPNSLAARVALAYIWERRAWEFRGSDSVDKVTPAQWLKVADALKTATGYLQGIRPEDDAMSLSVWMDIEWLEGDFDGGQKSFRQIQSIYPHFYEPYQTEVRMFYPQWYGSPEILAEFLTSLGKPTASTDQLIAYSYVAQSEYTLGRCCESPAKALLDWSAIQRGFAARASQYGLRHPDWNTLLNMAIGYGDCEVAEEAIVHIGDQWDPNVWGTKAAYDANVDWVRKHEQLVPALIGRVRALWSLRK